MIIGIVAVALLFGIYVVLDQGLKEKSGLNKNATSTTTNIDGTDIKTDGTGGYTIEQVPLESGAPQPIPDLNRPVHPAGSATVSNEAIVRATEKILPLQETLKKNPLNFYAWLDLGIYQKMAGDYEGSSISWQYASKIAPNDFISLGNLGNLYAYFLNDKVRAENYYKQAIVKGPTQSILYYQLAEVYMYLFNDKAKALATIDQGLSHIPNDASLLQLKVSFSK